VKQFDPFDHGIYKRFLDEDGNILSTAWNRAVEGGEHVATCRNCGFHMLAVPTTTNGRITWYGARCVNVDQCGKEIGAPNGEALRRSSRWGEMPEGYWANRLKALRQVSDAQI
jgi:hypothetical protein